MCLITFAWKQHPQAALVLAANRDEFHARPASAADFWEDDVQLLAGRDLEAGGTWLGISRRGRFAAITNVRDPSGSTQPGLRSRGDLTRTFLAGDEGPASYLQTVARNSADYQGFNLLVGDGESLWYLYGCGGTTSRPRALAPGVYGLSNAALDVPWPKVERAKESLVRTLRRLSEPLPGAELLRACVSDRRLAAEQELHGHGLSGDMAQRLSAQFIITPTYGTRCCSTLVWQTDGCMEFTEQRYDASGNTEGERRFSVATARKA
ncbi:MAG: hypothetical protein ACI87W_000685 [Halieaceae bacterium]|jgi:uncharacterized protein with NRDE domain